MYRKRNKKEFKITFPWQQQNDAPLSASAGGPAQKIPLTLYNAVQLALVASTDTCSGSYASDFDFAKKFVYDIALSYKSKKLLPVEWELDLNNGNIYLPDDNNLLWLKGKKNYPSTTVELNDVPLSDDEHGSWLQFKSLVLAEPTYKSCLDCGKIPSSIEHQFVLSTSKSCLHCGKIALSIEHPFVLSVGSFAVQGYNIAFEKFVEPGNYTRLFDPIFHEATYYITNSSYYFDVIFEAGEDGFVGLYKALVGCRCVDGKKSLRMLKFRGPKPGTRYPFQLNSPKVPASNSCRTGLVERRTFNGIMYGLYDYHDPTALAG